MFMISPMLCLSFCFLGVGRDVRPRQVCGLDSGFCNPLDNRIAIFKKLQQVLRVVFAECGFNARTIRQREAFGVWAKKMIPVNCL